MNSASAVGITLGELIAVAAAIVIVLWTLGKIGLQQFRTMIDERFATIDQKLRTFDPLHGELARVDKDLVQVRLEMSQNYVRQDGMRHLSDRMDALNNRMEGWFREVFDKLDSKADKSECPTHNGNGGRKG